MAIVAYSRLRMLWGAFDWQGGSENPYTNAQTNTGGTDATGGVGSIAVRRCVVTIDRSTIEAGADPCAMHFDFLNYTSGAPDDSWTTGDFTTLEGLLDTFYGTVSGYIGLNYKLTQYAWYRVGEGVGKPNPAVRTLVKGTPITFAGTKIHPPQVACSITFRTAVRKSWGRTYMPASAMSMSTTMRAAAADVDVICGAANTLVTAAASNDFQLVVTSRPLHTALAVERVEVDDVLDVIRRRRHKKAVYKKLLP